MTAQDDESWFAVDGLCSVNRGLESINVFANFADVLNMPSIGTKALRRIVGQSEFGWSIDRYVVVIVNCDKPVETKVTSERRCLVRDPFLKISVATEHKCVMVE